MFQSFWNIYFIMPIPKHIFIKKREHISERVMDVEIETIKILITRLESMV